MTSPSLATPLFVGMFGGGTVGGGVYQLVQRLASNGATTLRRPIVIKTICVRSLDKARDFEIDAAVTSWTTDPQAILQDETIDCVVEVMGGTGLAKTVVLDALQAHKSVVTANKALLAEHLTEVAAAAATAAETNESATPAALAYEAAVCGGIPIIQLLQACYAGDAIQSMTGICNGTTNYMLCKMEQGADYAAVLKEAQDLGYAEADPTADVEGHDVRAKIALLAKLAFGHTVSPVEAIPCQGISSIAAVDFDYCGKHGTTIKLTGTAKLLEKDGETPTLAVYVSPVMVPRSHYLASASGSGNIVAVTSANLGTACYSGPGAGRFPTANSVVADLVRLANGTVVRPPFPRQGGANYQLASEYSAPIFYVRLPTTVVGVAAVAAVAQATGVPLAALETVRGHLCLLTGACTSSQVQAFCDQVVSPVTAEVSGDKPLFMPFLSE